MDMVSHAGALVGLQDLLNAVATTDAALGAEVSIQTNDNPEEPATNVAAEKPKGKKKATGKKPSNKKTAGKGTETPVAASEAPQTTQDTTAEPETPQEPAKPKLKKIFFGRNVIGRLEHRLGADLGKRLVLTTDDVELPEADFNAAVEAAKEAFKQLPVKQQYLASMLIERAQGTRQSLTPVLDAAMRLIASKRSLTSASLQERMMAGDRKHGKTTAATQAGPAIRTLEAMKVIVAVKDGYEPNDRSTLLAMLSERMALSFVDVEASIAEAEAKEAEELAALQAVIKVETNDPVDEIEPPAPADEPEISLASSIDATLMRELEALGA